MAERSGNTDLLPSLPQRVKRSHRKSRSGCIVCKRRRIKCDEVRPKCVKCQIRSLECGYGDQAAHVSQRQSPTDRTRYENSTWPTPSSLPSPGTEQPQSPAGAGETELIEHYFSHTMQGIAESISNHEEMSDLWRITVPALAYTSSPVRRGMLTLAALCLHFDSLGFDSPASQSRYREAAESHGEVFVEASRRLLQSLQPSEVNSILACSRLLGVLSLAFYRIHRSNGITFADEAAWRWLHLLRGVLTAHDTISESGGCIDPFIARDMIGKNYLLGLGSPSPTTKANLKCKHPLLPLIEQSQNERFAALNNAVEGGVGQYDEQKYKDLNAAIKCLREATGQICKNRVPSLPRAIFLWPVGLAKGFVEMLEQLNPLALSIYAHWLLLVILLEDIWWVDDMGRSGILEVLDMCASSGAEKSALLEWPRRALDVPRS